jgi:hypothetical protein
MWTVESALSLEAPGRWAWGLGGYFVHIDSIFAIRHRRLL